MHLYYIVLILYCTYIILYLYYIALILYCTYIILYLYYILLILYCTYIILYLYYIVLLDVWRCNVIKQIIIFFNKCDVLKQLPDSSPQSWCMPELYSKYEPIYCNPGTNSVVSTYTEFTPSGDSEL